MNKIRNENVFYFVLITLLFCTTNLSFAQTTGKIAGKVLDAASGDPLVGANVLIEGTTLGAAVGPDGEFFILNVPPGLYSIRIQMMGYETVKVEELRVSVNRTANIDIKMKQAVLEGEVVVIQAEKVAIKKDQTSSVRNVSSDQIDLLPVENMGAVIDMQAGVVGGHFRGGRDTEVAYLVDGVEVTESFNGDGRAVDLEPESIQDLEVITGTFNAEYGKAMSGIVNAVTKDGGREFHGSVSSNLANYFTPHNDIFIGLKESDLNRNQDYKLQLSGPIWGDQITFFTNFRYQDNKNHLNGVRRFNVDDFSYFQAADSMQWYSEHNGDSAYVSMDRDKNLSFMGKVTLKPFTNFKMSFLYSLNDDEWHDYNHEYKYNPDGMASSYRTTNLYTLSFNHTLSSRLFYELKLSYIDNYNGWYVFKNPTDTNYVHDAYHNNMGPGFYTGGQEKDHSRHTLLDRSAKFDLTWQVNKNHSLKTGVLYISHDVDRHWHQIRNYHADTDSGDYWYPVFGKDEWEIVFPNYDPVVKHDSTVYSDIYHVEPIEYSAYIQDKMEFDEMVINAGIRFDYFHPKTYYPSQLRNPSNQLNYPNNPEKMSDSLWAGPKYQISPRIGLAYQLGESALLHFSYGHFFQMPPMYAIYQNNSHKIAPGDYDTEMGNAQIKAQKTVQYEIGLWQEIIKGMGVEVIVFYRDIYDLLSTKIISTFNQIEYGLYSNKDYGNVKGLEIKYDFVYNSFSAFLNYTLQYTRGNADNPTQTFDREGDNRDPINRLIPMEWDQRQTLNITVGYNAKNYGATLTGYYNSGSPYTWTPISKTMLARVNLYPNNDWRPSRYSIDLNSYYDFNLTDKIKLKLTCTVYNLLDRLNEEWVDANTGRAYTDVIRDIDIASHRSDFNEYIDRVENPSMYSAPRMVKVGLGLVF